MFIIYIFLKQNLYTYKIIYEIYEKLKKNVFSNNTIYKNVLIFIIYKNQNISILL